MKDYKGKALPSQNISTQQQQQQQKPLKQSRLSSDHPDTYREKVNYGNEFTRDRYDMRVDTRVDTRIETKFDSRDRYDSRYETNRNDIPRFDSRTDLRYDSRGYESRLEPREYTSKPSIESRTFRPNDQRTDHGRTEMLRFERSYKRNSDYIIQEDEKRFEKKTL